MGARDVVLRLGLSELAFEFEDRFLRFGFGRTNFPQALSAFQELFSPSA